jgi:hypothetical protein
MPRDAQERINDWVNFRGNLRERGKERNGNVPWTIASPTM